MRIIRPSVFVASTALALLLGCQAQAASITYVFTVTATQGPLNGVTSTGTFTFDTSAITPGATNSDPALLTDLDFVWDGITYDEITANTGYLTFDGAGVLTSATFGNFCSPGTCQVTPGLEQWWVGGTAFDYSVSGATVGYAGTVTMSQTPEPASILLMLSSMVALFVGWRKRLAPASNRLALPRSRG
jgi:hypothetical protein